MDRMFKYAILWPPLHTQVQFCIMIHIPVIFISFNLLSCSSQGIPENLVHQLCSDSLYFNYFNKFYYHSLQNGLFCAFFD